MDKFVFNKEKTLNAVLFIASKVNRADFHKIFKILYFSDREHLAKYGTTITGDMYVAMDAGPVPSKLYDILKIVRGDSYSQDLENFSSLFEVINWMYVKPKKEADLRKLSRNNIAVIEECISIYGNMTYDEIKEKSHDIAWRSTAKDYIINIKDIAYEAGLTDEDIPYIEETNQLNRAIN